MISETDLDINNAKVRQTGICGDCGLCEEEGHGLGPHLLTCWGQLLGLGVFLKSLSSQGNRTLQRPAGVPGGEQVAVTRVGGRCLVCILPLAAVTWEGTRLSCSELRDDQCGSVDLSCQIPCCARTCSLHGDQRRPCSLPAFPLCGWERVEADMWRDRAEERRALGESGSPRERR